MKKVIRIVMIGVFLFVEIFTPISYAFEELSEENIQKSGIIIEESELLLTDNIIGLETSSGSSENFTYIGTGSGENNNPLTGDNINSMTGEIVPELEGQGSGEFASQMEGEFSGDNKSELNPEMENEEAISPLAMLAMSLGAAPSSTEIEYRDNVTKPRCENQGTQYNGVVWNCEKGTITVTDGSQSITMKDMNVGATTVGYGEDADIASYGLYYQWGGMTGYPYEMTPEQAIEAGFITDNATWSSRTSGWTKEQQTQLCGEGYHIPTSGEFQTLINMFIANGNSKKDFYKAFKFPFAGWREYDDATIYMIWELYRVIDLWTSTPQDGDLAYDIEIYSEDAYINNTWGRAYGYPIRCFKNVDASIIDEPGIKVTFIANPATFIEGKFADGTTEKTINYQLMTGGYYQGPEEIQIPNLEGNYMFEGWYTNDLLTPESRWTGLNASTTYTAITLYAKYLPFNDKTQTWGGVTFTIMDRNLGATDYVSGYSYGIDNSPVSVRGNYYQWGNNFGFPTEPTGVYANTLGGVLVKNYSDNQRGPGNYYFNGTFIKKSDRWDEEDNRNLWGGMGETRNIVNSDADKQGPCPVGYHVPSTYEWQVSSKLFQKWQATEDGMKYCNSIHATNVGSCMLAALGMPFAGYRDGSTSSVTDRFFSAHYWSSTVYNNMHAYRLDANASKLDPQYWDYRARAFSLRCFKNSSILTLTFDSNGGGEVESQTGFKRWNPRNNEPIPERAHSVFSGWYSDENLTQEFTFSDTTYVSENKTLYAKWDCEEGYELSADGKSCKMNNSIVVTIEVNNPEYGSVSQNSISAFSGDTIELNENILTIGSQEVIATSSEDTSDYIYVLSGWNNTCGNTLTHDCTITVEFAQATGLVINYNLNGGYLVENHSTDTFAVHYEYSDGKYTTTQSWKTPSKSEGTCEGKNCMFDGWYLEESGTTRWTGYIDSSFNGKTVYAKWLPFEDLQLTFSGITFTIMDRNLGALSSGTGCNKNDTSTCGYHFQWGNNYGFKHNGSNVFPNGETTSGDPVIDRDSYVSTYYNGVFSSVKTWNSGSTINDNLWGGNNTFNSDEGRQGPCPEGYHVPDTLEWQAVGNIIDAQSDGNYFSDVLKLPFGGAHAYDNRFLSFGKLGAYWSSSPSPLNSQVGQARYVNFTESSIALSSSYYHSYALSVRCFKDTPDFTLSFDSNGGSEVPSVTGKWWNLKSAKPTDDPNKENNVFSGWYLDSDFNDKFEFSNTAYTTGNIQLYAKWDCAEGYILDESGQCVLNSHIEVTFIANPSTFSDGKFLDNTTSKVIAYELKTGGYFQGPEEIQIPNLSGYMFEGWYTDTSYSTESRRTGLTVNSPSEMILYARYLPFEEKTQTWDGVTFTIMDRNLGATDYVSGYSYGADNSPVSVRGNYYQWGNNFGFPSEGTYPNTLGGVLVENYQGKPRGPGNYYFNGTFIKRSDGKDSRWDADENRNLWGGLSGSDADKQGPCPAGYHVPRKSEWSATYYLFQKWQDTAEGLDYCNSIDETNTGVQFCMLAALGMPFAGNRVYSTSLFKGQGTTARYWSSTAYTNGSNTRDAYSVSAESSNINIGNGLIRASAFSVRCFKDSDDLTLTFDSNGGSEVESQTGFKRWNPRSTKPVKPDRANSIFSGWYSDSGFVNEFTFSSNTYISEDKTLYAKWDCEEYYTGSVDGQSCQPINDENKNGIADELEDKFTVSFVSTGNGTLSGTAIYENILTGLTLSGAGIEIPEIAANQYYEFSGWTPIEPTGEFVVTENLTFTGEFKPINDENDNGIADEEETYNLTITYEYSRGGEATGSYEMGVVYNRNYSVESPSIEHYIASPLVVSGTMGNTGVIVNVVYSPINDENENGIADELENKFTVSFVSTGNGTLSGTAIYENILTGLTISGAGIKIPTPVPSTYYIFSGWDKEIPSGDMVVTGNLVYVAYFKPIHDSNNNGKADENEDFTVTFDSKLGSPVTGQVVHYGAKVTRPGNPTKSGYTFTGWYEDEIYNLLWDFENRTITGNVMLYAKWNDKQITEIRVKTEPTKTGYIEGEVVNMSGLVIEVTYDNGEKELVPYSGNESLFEINPTGEITYGTTGIEITYEGKTVDYPVEVATKELEKIEITSAPEKTSYIEGQELNLSGMEITVTYDNGKSEVIPYSGNESLFTTNPANGSKLGTGNNKVEISYTTGGITKTTTQSITVSDKQITEITVKTEPTKTGYIEGEVVNMSGLVIEVTYDNGETGTVAYPTSGLIINPIGEISKGTTGIEIIYEGKTVDYPVVVSEKKMTGIEITRVPEKTSYIEGQELNLSGMEITVTYDNGKSEVIPYSGNESLFTTNPANGSKLGTGNNKVEISYTTGGITKTATQSITVSDKQITGITVKAEPTKTRYIEGEVVNMSGLVIEVTYDNGEKELVPYSGNESLFEINPTGEISKGTTGIEITYEGKTVDYPVVVSEKKMTGIEITRVPEKTSYIEGQELNLSGMEITVTYDNGKSEVIPYSGNESLFTTNPANGSKLGTGNNKVEISYTTGGITSTGEVMLIVVNKVVTDIEITTVPEKTHYTEGETLDLSGLVIKVIYNDGDIRELPYSEYSELFTISPTEGAKVSNSDTYVIIRFEGQEVKQPIYVEKKTEPSVPTSNYSGGGRRISPSHNGHIGTDESVDDQSEQSQGNQYSEEMNDAYKFAYKHGITTMDTIEKADMDGYVLRSHLAKMLSQFAVNVMGKTPDLGKRGCEDFADIQGESEELKGYIKTACKLGLMGLESDGETVAKNFNPTSYVSRAEFGTTLSRLLYGDENNLKSEYDKDNYERYEKHLLALKKEGIMTQITGEWITNKELRGYVMLMLMRSAK